jgi:FHS family L-fucose permease-like MFS transporter
MQISTPNLDPVAAAQAADPDTPVFPTTHRLPFILVTVLFFLWGMSNNLTDPLIQQFKKVFDLTPLKAQLVQTAVFCGYLVVALPAAFFMRKFGYKTGIVTGLCLFGCGMLLFWPAAVVGQYGLFLAALFVIGCGSGILETAANPFIAQFGHPATSERRLNVSQAFNPPGTIIGVLLGAYVILSGVELSPSAVDALKQAGTYVAHMHTELMRVVPTYAGLGAIVLLLALWIGLIRFPAFANAQPVGDDQGSLRELLHYPQLWLAVVAQFCYCGAQVSTWSNQFFYVKQYSQVTERSAFLYLIAALVALAIGRAVSTPLMRYIRPSTMMGVYALINMALCAVAVLRPGILGAYALVATSFFMSIMFPTIFALGVKGLGANTKLGGSVIVMAVGGAAALPPLVGLIAGKTGSYALGYIVPLAAYLVVAAYSFTSRRDLSLESVDRAPEIF